MVFSWRNPFKVVSVYFFQDHTCGHQLQLRSASVLLAMKLYSFALIGVTVDLGSFINPTTRTHYITLLTSATSVEVPSHEH